MAGEESDPPTDTAASPGDAFRFCGVREAVLEEARRREFAWRTKRDLKVYIGDRIPGIPELGPIVLEVVAPISAHCNLRFSLTAKQPEADLIVLTRPIDGSGGTLAEHELPPGDDRPLRGWYDVGERWTMTHPPGQFIFLPAVMRHEMLHGMGLPHAPRGMSTLMAPFYSPEIINLGPWEINELMSRYGPPVAPPPPEEPPQVEAEPIIVKLEGQKSGRLYAPVIVFPEVE